MTPGRRSGATRAPARVSPARAVAFAVLRRVFEQDAYADRALEGEATRAALDARDRALATALAFGAVQRRGTLDHVIEDLAGRGVAQLDPPVLAALRLGLQQLLFLHGIPDHAAVDESVELAKRDSPRGAGLVNAVLRRGARERGALLAALDDTTPAGAAVAHSHPPWLAELWWEALGAEEARALMTRDNEPPEAAIRANALVTSAAELAARLAAAGVASRPAPELPEGLVLASAFDAHASPLFAAGALMPQSRASMHVARLLAPEPGERILDLCAAPGAKTTHLAALSRDAGEIVAVERHAGRAEALRVTCARMCASSIRVETADATAPRADGPFDRVLVDPPCSGLGTLQARPDLRWRASPERIAAVVPLQAAILDAAAAALGPGGVLVYSTCTISEAENQAQVGAALARHPGLALEAEHRFLPHRDGTDGFYLARLRRSAGG